LSVQNPNAQHRTAPWLVRASQFFALVGVFVVVPGAGLASNTLPKAEQVAPFNVIQPLYAKTDSPWDQQFSDIMQRVWKWWQCAVPDESPIDPSQEMEEFNACYREHGLPSEMPEADRRNLENELDDLLELTNKPPAEVGSGSVSSFRSTLIEILSKL